MIDFSTATDLQILTLYSVLSSFKAIIDSHALSPDLYDKQDFSREVNRLFNAVENISIDRGLI